MKYFSKDFDDIASCDSCTAKLLDDTKRKENIVLLLLKLTFNYLNRETIKNGLYIWG